MTTVWDSVAVDDPMLVERVRRGDRDAFAALYQEHATGAWRLALAVCRQPAAAANAVAEAFGKVLTHADRGAPGPQSTFRLQLLAATRNAAIDGHQRRDGAATNGANGGPALAAPSELARSATGADRATLAFEQLPERSRSLLWLTEVEGLDAPEAATVLGVSAEGTAQLASRAHAGLREHFARAQVRSASQPDCQRTALRLGGYVTDTLSPRDTTRVRRHLDRCLPCRVRLDEVDDLVPRLRRSVLPLPLAVFGAAEQAWATSTTTAKGPLGVTLPGGRPLSPWAERALAGAAAAAIALGITGAVIAGGRGGKDRGDHLARDAGTEQPIGPADGESALGDDDGTTDGPMEDGGAPAEQPAGTPPVGGSPTGGTSNPTPGSSTGEVPRRPNPTAPSNPPLPGAVDPGGPDPVDPPPAATVPPLVTIRIDDSTGVSIGGPCTGMELLGVVVVCEPPAESTLPSGAPPASSPALGLGL